MKVKSPSKDFKCSCGCGQKVRVVFICWGKNGQLVDISIIQRGKKRSDFGVVLRSDDRNSLGDFIKFISKKHHD